ncbi:hypothetical protein K2X89_01980 [Myxococcota bacterium]|nr:hypothetical protein [Myxococcota bacterium]
MDAKTRRISWITGSLVLAALGAADVARAAEPAGTAFDRAFRAGGPSSEAGAIGIAGPVVTRFAPPVAAPIDPASATLPLALTRSPLLRPCDVPGSGCRNAQAAPPPVVVPPIGPGTRPPHSPNP